MKTINYFKPYKWRALLAFFAKIIEAILELLIPLVVARLIDFGINPQNTSVIWQMGFLLFLLPFLGYLAAMVCQWHASYVGQHIGTDLREASFKKVNQMDTRQLEDLSSTSAITRITNDTQQIQLAVAMVLRLASRIPVLLVGAIVMSFLVSPELAPIFIIGAIVLAAMLSYLTHLSNQGYGRIQTHLDRISASVRENLSGIRVIRAFANQDAERNKFKNYNNRLTKEQIQVGRIQALANPSSTMLVNIAIAFILYYGARLVNASVLMQGDVVALVNYMNAILLALNVLVQIMGIYARGYASISRLDELLDYDPKIEDKLEADPDSEPKLELGPLSVNFNQVDFAYNQKNVLTDIDFSVEAGQFIGIIGATASGKSTVGQLIPRFYDVTDGEILINGRNVKAYSTQDLRGKMALVPQKTVLFEGTIRENLQMAAPGASDEDIWRALDLAQAAPFVADLEDDLDSLVNQGGRNFSGGQRQRLTIARAIIQGAGLIILDDSMSALDFQTEAHLRHALQELPATVILISQRISSLRSADKILVLDEGRQVGFDKHESLLASNPVYQAIHDSQEEKAVSK